MKKPLLPAQHDGQTLLFTDNRDMVANPRHYREQWWLKNWESTVKVFTCIQES